MFVGVGIVYQGNRLVVQGGVIVSMVYTGGVMLVAKVRGGLV